MTLGPSASGARERSSPCAAKSQPVGKPEGRTERHSGVPAVGGVDGPSQTMAASGEGWEGGRRGTPGTSPQPAGLRPGGEEVRRAPVPSCACSSVKLWNGIVAAGYGNGQIRLYEAATGLLRAEVNAHARWIYALDLAPQTGKVRLAVPGHLGLCVASPRPGIPPSRSMAACDGRAGAAP